MSNDVTILDNPDMSVNFMLHTSIFLEFEFDMESKNCI